MVSFRHPQPSLLVLTYNSKHWAELFLPFHVIVSFRSTTSGPQSTPRQALLFTLYGSRSFSVSLLT
jgi:hypothetical protein